MKKHTAGDPPRPLCMCGSPGHFQVSIEVQELKLERDAGIASRPYWLASHRSGTRIETIMCAACVKANVSLSLTATASVANGKEL